MQHYIRPVELTVEGIELVFQQDITRDLLQKVAQGTAEFVFRVVPHVDQRASYQIALAITSDEEIRRLNAQYRAKDMPTDVLSFGFFDSIEHLEDIRTHVGELVISYAQVQAQAQEFHHSETFEFLFLFVHGILHLFGYTDDTDETREEMERIGYDILASLGMTDTH